MVNRYNNNGVKKKDFGFVFCFLPLQVRSEHSYSQQKEALEIKKRLRRLVKTLEVRIGGNQEHSWGN